MYSQMPSDHGNKKIDLKKASFFGWLTLQGNPSGNVLLPAFRSVDRSRVHPVQVPGLALREQPGPAWGAENGMPAGNWTHPQKVLI